MAAARERLASTPAAITAARGCDHSSLSAQDLLDLRGQVAAVRRELEFYDHQLMSLATKPDAHKTAGAGSMVQLTATETGVSVRDAARNLKLAEHLNAAPALAAQMTLPGMSTDKAHVVTSTVEKPPADLSATEREAVETDLAQAAPAMSLDQLKRKAGRALEVIDMDRANQIENERLKQQEARATRTTMFWMTQPDDDGMVTGGFTLDALTGDILRAAIEAKTSPQRHTEEPAALDDAVLPEAPTYKEKAGTAFTDLLRHLPVDGFGNHGGVAATLMVTISESTLRGQCDKAGVTEFGTPVSARQLRQLACKAGILPPY